MSTRGGGVVELLGIRPERVEVVPHGLDAKRFTPAADGDEALLAKLDLPERFVVYPANLWPHKNHARLVDALAMQREKDVNLVLTGQSWNRLEQLMDRAARAGRSARVCAIWATSSRRPCPRSIAPPAR